MKRSIITTFVLAAVLVLSGCNFPLASSNNNAPDENLINTAVAQTVQALQAQQPTAVAPTSAPVPTLAPLPTMTAAAPVATYAPLPSATPIPCNKALFVSETIPDDSSFEPGKAFKKTWRLKNIGTCTWTTAYKLAFASGDQLGGPNAINFPISVKPNESVDLLLDLKAPATAGTYTSNWRMVDESGTAFAQVYTRIKVGAPAFFAVTSVQMTIDNDNYSGSCPHTVNFSAKIYASAPGTVTYSWQPSVGSPGAEQQLVFSAAGNQTVTTSWELNADGNYSMALYVNNPNHQTFGPWSFALNCE